MKERFQKILCNRKLTKLVLTIAVAAGLTALAATAWFLDFDGGVSDRFYQRTGGSDGEVVVIGIDQRALDELGPFPWPRRYMAEAIEYLNSDPDNRPAVIGVDVLYVGEGSDPDDDAYLVEVAGEYGNVLFASAATFGNSVVTLEDGSFYLRSDAVQGWDEPFPALMDVSRTGHINASMDEGDGILRHAMLWVDVPDKGRVYSFSRVIYEMWCEAKGVEPNPVPQTDVNATFYIPFTGKPGEYYENVSVVDLLNGEVEPDYFAGKVVLIGPYAAGMQDGYVTSADHSKSMYGIEIQANLIDAYRNGKFDREVSETVQLVIAFAICFAIAFLLWDMRMRNAVFIWLGCLVAWIAACYAAHQAGYILHVSVVPVIATTVFVASVAMNYTRAAMEKRQVQNAFQHYVDPVVMGQLLEQGNNALELGGKMYDIAVLFVDIRGFTTMSESLDPQTVVEIINRYLSLTTECIMENHGTLDKFVGDCTMAFWNAPIHQEQAVYLACKAAMAMVERSKALGAELQERFGRTVDFGVGVNWGPAVVGNIGSSKRMDYTAIGDTVNTASRLEANAPGGKIYISRAVADVLGERAKVTSLGNSIKLKGKKEGFEVLTLDELRGMDGE